MAYGDPAVRKAVPLALGLISASNPQLTILETLSRYSHDNDLDVAVNAILAMGMIGAGTNNARLAQMLRQLAGYYNKEPNCLFMVRVAQVSRVNALQYHGLLLTIAWSLGLVTYGQGYNWYQPVLCRPQCTLA